MNCVHENYIQHIKTIFPTHRPRRLPSHPQLRRMVSETILTTNDLIYPLFAVPGKGVAKEVISMPGVFQLSVDKIVDEVKEVYDLGIPAVILSAINYQLWTIPRCSRFIATIWQSKNLSNGSWQLPRSNQRNRIGYC